LVDDIAVADQNGRLWFQAPDDAEPVYVTAVGDTSGDIVKMIPANLTERIDDAEGDITSLDARMTTAETDITALETADGALDARLDTAENDINALETADISLDGRLDTAEATLATTTTTANAAQTTANQAAADIDAADPVYVGDTNTSRAVSGTSYAAISGVPTVAATVPASGKVWVQFGGNMTPSSAAVGNSMSVSIASTGANTIVASDDCMLYCETQVVSKTNPVALGRGKLLTGLTPGSTTFVLHGKRVGTTNATIHQAYIYVEPKP
jgi:hypothetical protein